MRTRKVFYKTIIIPCETLGIRNIEHITVCRFHGDASYVGSIACHHCKKFVSDTYIEADQCGVVECKDVENRRDSSTAVEFPNENL